MIRTYEKPTALALSVSYDNLLPVDTVANLKEGFGMLGMRFTGQPRKAEIASMYADYVKNHPAEVLQRLTLDSLTQISQILQKGKGGCVTLNGINLFTQLQKTNLVVTWENEYEGKSYPDDSTSRSVTADVVAYFQPLADIVDNSTAFKNP